MAQYTMPDNPDFTDVVKAVQQLHDCQDQNHRELVSQIAKDRHDSEARDTAVNAELAKLGAQLGVVLSVFGVPDGATPENTKSRAMPMRRTTLTVTLGLAAISSITGLRAGIDWASPVASAVAHWVLQLTGLQ